MRKPFSIPAGGTNVVRPDRYPETPPAGPSQGARLVTDFRNSEQRPLFRLGAFAHSRRLPFVRLAIQNDARGVEDGWRLFIHTR
ncbi:hypothetical protein BH10PLA2_BH10PLA2_04990 [soil metagenome]